MVGSGQAQHYSDPARGPRAAVTHTGHTYIWMYVFVNAQL